MAAFFKNGKDADRWLSIETKADIWFKIGKAVLVFAASIALLIWAVK